MLENSKILVEIKMDFEKRLLELENDLDENQYELLRTKEELTRTKLQLTIPRQKPESNIRVSL